MSELPDLQKRCDFSDEGGEKILYAWDDDTAYGWYIGTICNTRLGVRDMRAVPRANRVVKYDKNDNKLATNWPDCTGRWHVSCPRIFMGQTSGGCC